MLALCGGLRSNCILNGPEVMSLILHQALSSRFFGAAMAHDISLSHWFLSAAASFMTADNSSYFKSLVMLLKECISEFFVAGEFSGK